MNKSVKRALLIFLLIALISTISYCSAPFDTETARSVSLRQSVTGSGFILRKETPVTNKSGGVFEYSVKDGDRVSRGSSVGVVISGNLSASLASELAQITARIEEIKEADNIASIYSSDEARIFSAMRDLTSSIRSSAYSENYVAATESATQLGTLLEKKYSAENKSSADQLLVSLEERKFVLEQQLGGIREEIYAPASGYFYTALDGLEDYGSNEKKTASLTPLQINEFSQTLKDYQKGSAVAKITDTYVWYLAATVPAEDADSLTPGVSVRISVDEAPPVSATVLAVNKDATGEAAIIISSNKNVVGIYEKRTAEFEIYINEYSGLYVPSAAIRVTDGVTGVYTINNNKNVTFKCVDILYQDDDYYIVNSKYSPPADIPFKPLMLYDNILVNPEATNIDDSSK